MCPTARPVILIPWGLGKILVCALVGATLAGGCVGSESTPCGQEVCPKGWACHEFSDRQTCVLPWQLTACAEGSLVDGDQCDNEDNVGYQCVEGVCVRGACGDGVADSTEECDDGVQNSTTEPDACRPSCRLPRCGDGVVDPSNGEFCDAGDDNSDEADRACRPNCEPQRCGDGILDTESGEICDDGNSLPGDGCSAICLLESCGNGVIDAGEQCDDGNAADGDECQHTCLLPRCGDNILDEGAPYYEICDSGGDNSDAPDAACRPNCSPRRCGDHILDSGHGEQCDDGNIAPGDGCSTTCLLESCGNGVVDATEQCDDGNNTSGDGCQADCAFPRCGDGVVDLLSGEECDGASVIASVTCQDLGFYFGTPTCDSLCHISATTCSGRCGDDTVDLGEGETCDGSDFGGLGCLDYGYYGGTISCQSNCQVALGQCNGRCGDGFVNGGEVCDGVDFNGVSCADYGYYTGSLACASDCQTITPSCEETCGDGEINGLEECDSDDVDQTYCMDLAGFAAGRLNCNQNCERKLDYCFAPGWRSRLTEASGTLLGLWGSASDNIYAVGVDGEILRNQGGAGWRLQPSGVIEDLRGIWGSADDDIYVVGESGTILHFDGSGWLPMVSPVTTLLRGIWGASPTDIWAVGDGGVVLHYNGLVWEVEPLGLTQDIRAIWGSAADNVFIVGSSGLVRRFNGTTWEVMDDQSGVLFEDVHGLDAQHVWVVGGLLSGDWYDHVRFYDGSSWTTQLTKGTGAGRWASLRTVWAISPTLVFAAGVNGSKNGSYWRFDGTTWAGEPGVSTIISYDMWGLPTSKLYTVGEQGTVLQYGGDGAGWVEKDLPGTSCVDVLMLSETNAVAACGATLQRWDGTGWTLEMTVTGSFISLWASSPSNIYALSNEGGSKLYRYNGVSWSLVPGVPSLSSPKDIFGLPTGELYLKGDYEHWAVFNGTSWTTRYNWTSDCWIGNSVWGTSPSDLWVVGRRCISHYDGTSWTKVHYPSSWLYNVIGSSSNDVWAFGSDGLVMHYDGLTWEKVDVPTAEYVNGAWITEQGELFVVGAAGTILWFDGVGWSPMASPTRATISKVHGISRNHMVAVGSAFLEFTGDLAQVPFCGQGGAPCSTTAWSHSIAIDGVNDFSAQETFTTGSAGFTGHVTWDATHLYLGFDGVDVGSGDPFTWVHAYVGGFDGTNTGQVYNSQQPELPFKAKAHLRWKADDSYTNLQIWTGWEWTDVGFGGAVARNGQFVELSLPWSAIGNTRSFGVHLSMVNEIAGGEWSWASVPEDSFTDGTDPDYGQYFLFDRSSPAAPASYAPRY